MHNTIAKIIIDDNYVSIQQDPDSQRIICWKYRGHFCDFAVFDLDDQEGIVEYVIAPLPQSRLEYRVADEE